MQLVGYIRVSTTNQVEDGDGLAIQEKQIRDWCRTHGHRLTAIHADEGISGTKDADIREGLSDAIAAVKYNGAEGIVIATMDRLARDHVVQELTLREVWASGGKVFAADNGEVLENDPDNPTTELIRVILGAVSTFEAQMVRARLRRGKAHKKAAGGFVGGMVPFGFRSEGGDLVPDAGEQEALTTMREMRETGKSYRDIAKHLNDAGITAKSGGQWYPSTVRSVMMRQQE